MARIETERQDMPERETDRQTDRQTETELNMKRERERENGLHIASSMLS